MFQTNDMFLTLLILLIIIGIIYILYQSSIKHTSVIEEFKNSSEQIVVLFKRFLIWLKFKIQTARLELDNATLRSQLKYLYLQIGERVCSLASTEEAVNDLEDNQLKDFIHKIRETQLQIEINNQKVQDIYLGKSF